MPRPRYMPTSSPWRTYLLPLRPRFRGITMIELMVTVALLAIVGAVAAPNFAEFIRSARLDQATRALSSALQFGRMEAIKRNRTTFVCINPANAQITVHETTATSASLRSASYSTSISLTTNGLESLSGMACIRYQSTGLAPLPSGFTGTRYWRLTVGTHNRCIYADPGGAVRTAQPTAAC